MPTYKKMKVTKAKDIRRLCADKGVKVDFILSHKLAKAFLACDLEKWIALGGSFDYLYNPYNDPDAGYYDDSVYTFKDVIIG